MRIPPYSMTIVPLACLLLPGVARADECANVLVVLDRSDSMNRLLVENERARWEVAVEAVEDLLERYSSNVKFGLSLFPGGTVETCDVACTPGFLAVDIASGSAEDIRATLGSAARCAGTPIAVTMEELPDVEGLREEGKRNFVLLITDGSETCPGDASAAARSLAQQDPEVRTFVIGFAEDINEDELDAIASAGRTQAAFVASDSDTLEAAFDEILGAVYDDPEFGCIGGELGDGGIPGFDSGVPEADAGTTEPPAGGEDDGCGCRVPGASPASSAAAVVVLPGALAVLARRRRRRG